jgi:magnesium-transporting ATPase (P-type)
MDLADVKQKANQAGAATAGLTSLETRRRLAVFGEKQISSRRRTGTLTLFISQFKSPIVPPHFYPILAQIILAYLISTEMAKQVYRQRV